MTARRSSADAEARISRALQFIPGHVGGRVASAQPVTRNSGTLRRPAVGEMVIETVPVDIDITVSQHFGGSMPTSVTTNLGPPGVTP